LSLSLAPTTLEFLGSERTGVLELLVALIREYAVDEIRLKAFDCLRSLCGSSKVNQDRAYSEQIGVLDVLTLFFYSEDNAELTIKSLELIKLMSANNSDFQAYLGEQTLGFLEVIIAFFPKKSNSIKMKSACLDILKNIACNKINKGRMESPLVGLIKILVFTAKDQNETASCSQQVCRDA
jgi:hypothetical protein